jgi:uncharacterized repeat protein (TIGR03803 family)
MRIKASIHISLLLAFCAAGAAQTPVFTKLANLNPYYHPYWGVVQGLNGQLYSTTPSGEAGRGEGEVFAITTGGQLTTVHTLNGRSETGLVLATDGNLYGTTYGGGLYESGTVFRVTPNGSLTTLHTFCAQTGCPDGSFPNGPLIQANDGNLYGTTTQGGPNCPAQYDVCGTVFRLTLAGELTTVYTFCLQAGCPDGHSPQYTIVQASDSNLYGVDGGGTGGEIFRLTLAGELTVLYDFCQQPGCPDGLGPTGLSIGPDGALYGATQSFSTIFKITLDGAFQVLDALCPGLLCAAADSPPVPATDGNLYGTIEDGGTSGYGAIYQVTTSGALTVLYNFCPAPPACQDGIAPFGPPFQATDGNLYGTTFGPPSTVWRLSLGLAPFVSPLPAYGKAGSRISILGTNLTGATAVSFNGTPAERFAVNSAGSAIATGVPKGATTGPIQVTLANGTVLSSNVAFQVNQ